MIILFILYLYGCTTHSNDKINNTFKPLSVSLNFEGSETKYLK